MKTILHTPKAPAAIGPYSQAVRWGDMLFCSGQIALLPNGDDSLLNEDVAIQCRQALENMEAILLAAGTGWENVVKVNVSLVDMADFADINAVYEQFFGDTKPARACVAVAGLPKGARIEIECIAGIPTVQ